MRLCFGRIHPRPKRIDFFGTSKRRGLPDRPKDRIRQRPGPLRAAPVIFCPMAPSGEFTREFRRKMFAGMRFLAERV